MVRGEAKNVLLILAEGFEDLEAATILDVCGWTAYRQHIPTVRVITTGLRNVVHGRFGLVIEPDQALSKVRPGLYGAVALPGGFRGRGYDEIYDERVYDLLRAIHAQGGTIATMCVGALPVAEAGLLKGRRATTYAHSRHDNRGQLRDCGAIVVDDPVVVDERMISCAGPAQSMEVALLLLDQLIGSEVVKELKRYLQGTP